MQSGVNIFQISCPRGREKFLKCKSFWEEFLAAPFPATFWLKIITLILAEVLKKIVTMIIVKLHFVILFTKNKKKYCHFKPTKKVILFWTGKVSKSVGKSFLAAPFPATLWLKIIALILAEVLKSCDHDYS